MGAALLTGLVTQGWAPADHLAVVEPLPARREELGRQLPGLVALAAPEPGMVAADGGAVVAVKPEQAEGACRLLGAVGVTRVISVVAGLGSARLEAALPDGSVVVRAMPNTPALVGSGMTAIAGGSNARAADLDWAEGVLSAVGRVIRLPERHLDAVTGLSGAGPAYVFLVAESLVEAGVLMGLPHDVSETLAVQTLLGSARLLAESGEGPHALRASVTSPGGATSAGLRALESRAVRSAFLEAVAAATERSRNLGR